MGMAMVSIGINAAIAISAVALRAARYFCWEMASQGLQDGMLLAHLRLDVEQGHPDGLPRQMPTVNCFERRKRAQSQTKLSGIIIRRGPLARHTASGDY